MDMTKFQLYQQSDKYTVSSSIFDMISTEKNLETKQTKALAYMLAYEPDFLKFIIGEIFTRWNKRIIKKRDCLYWKNGQDQWHFEVKAEFVLQERGRSDIVIQAKNHENKTDWIIVIEAKNMNANAQEQKTYEQQKRYVDYFHSLGMEPVIPVLLTKNIDFTYHSEGCIPLTWGDIVTFVQRIVRKRNCDRLFREFFDFLTGANRKMKFYEEDVISVPAGRTFDLVKEFGVYICPNTQKYNYKNTLYMTFRRHGGIMEMLYSVKRLYTLRCDEEELEQLEMPAAHREAILAYLKKAGENHPGKSNEMQVYILDKNHTIQLPAGTKPISSRGMAGHCYYRLSDMLNGEQSRMLVPVAQTQDNAEE